MENVTGVLQNPLFLAVLGIVFARAPKVRVFIANSIIPYIQTAIAFLPTLLGSLSGATVPANAWAGPLALDHYPQLMIGFNFFGSAGGLLGGLAGAAWQAAQSHLLYKLFLHKPLGRDPIDSKQ
jgi:hypothetical protein